MTSVDYSCGLVGLARVSARECAGVSAERLFDLDNRESLRPSMRDQAAIGDQSGVTPPSTSRVASDPSASATWTPTELSSDRNHLKANRRPSGDQAGSKACPGSRVTCTTSAGRRMSSA